MNRPAVSSQPRRAANGRLAPGRAGELRGSKQSNLGEDMDFGFWYLS